ncbi:MAG: hypothetical protein ACYST5_21850, partial [Planctomycetota bacterium]
MKTFNKTILFPLACFFFAVGIAAAAGMVSPVNSAAKKPKLYSTGNVLAGGNYSQWTSNNPFAVPT